MATIRVAILTVSDRSSRGEREDVSGPALKNKCLELGFDVVNMRIVPDEFQVIADQIKSWADDSQVDLILTTGGTGFSPRDVTPEATLSVVERPTPGIAEAMRSASLRITPHAMLSRSAAGIRGRTMIVNLPGSPKAALENMEIIQPVLPHAIELIQESPSSEKHH